MGRFYLYCQSSISLQKSSIQSITRVVGRVNTRTFLCFFFYIEFEVCMIYTVIESINLRKTLNY